MLFTRGLVVYFLAVLIACRNAPKQLNADRTTGFLLTSVQLKHLSGEPVDWKQYKGKTVFINFWATWCKPCIREMPSIGNLMGKIKNENIAFLFASDESPDQINRFRERTGFDFTFVRVENLEELNIMALPTTFIFTSSGQLAFSEMGFRRWDNKKNISIIQNIMQSK